MAKKIPSNAKVVPQEVTVKPPELCLKEEHVRQAVREWCAARGYNVSSESITWEMRNDGDNYDDQQWNFDGAVVVLPMVKPLVP